MTENHPNFLLKIGDSTILKRIFDYIDGINCVDKHIIINNHKFSHRFKEWKATLSYTKPITIVDDGTETNETRLGAVCDLLFTMDRLMSIDDDMLVVATENLLFFSFREFVDFARERVRRASCATSSHK